MFSQEKSLDSASFVFLFGLSCSGMLKEGPVGHLAKSFEEQHVDIQYRELHETAL